MKPHQMDLFEWADARPSAEIISIIPGVVRRMWRERGRPRINHDDVQVVSVLPDYRRIA